MTLSGRLMFDYMGWKDAADLVRDAVERTIVDRKEIGRASCRERV